VGLRDDSLIASMSARALPGLFLDFYDPWGKRVAIVGYDNVQFSKAPEGVPQHGFDAPVQGRAGDQGACRKGNGDGLTQQARPPQSVVLGARTCVLARLWEPDALA
jgi:hypothetical protein